MNNAKLEYVNIKMDVGVHGIPHHNVHENIVSGKHMGLPHVDPKNALIQAIIQMALISCKCGFGEEALKEFDNARLRVEARNLAEEFENTDPVVLNKRNEEKSLTYFEAVAWKTAQHSGFSIVCRSDTPFEQQYDHDGFYGKSNKISEQDKSRQIWYLGSGEIW